MILITFIFLNYLVFINGSCDFIDYSVNQNFYKSIKNNTEKLIIFEFIPQISNLKNSWDIGTFKIEGLKVNEFNIYIGDNISHVESLCKSKSLFFNSYNYIYNLFFDNKFRNLKFDFNPFISQSIGIKSLKENHNYDVRISFTFSLFLFSLTVFGATLFLNSRRLADSFYFHFSCAVLLSLCGTTVLIAFILSKFIPFRKTFFLISFIGNSIFFSFLLQMKDKMYIFIKDNAFIAAIYFVVVTFISSLLIYYYYPETMNRKTVNIINVLLKLLSIFGIFYSIYDLKIFGLIIIILIIPFQFFLSFIKKWKMKFYPGKRCFISADKYPEILKSNTQMELNKLRNYLKSPNFDTWGAVSKCKSVERLASFVLDGSHVSDNEMKDYFSTEYDMSDTDSSIEYNSK